MVHFEEWRRLYIGGWWPKRTSSFCCIFEILFHWRWRTIYRWYTDCKKYWVKTLAWVSFAIILFFLLIYSHSLIPTRWLELAIAITLYFFAAMMFKEVIENEDETRELDEKDQLPENYGYVGKCDRAGCIDFYRYQWCINRSCYLYRSIYHTSSEFKTIFCKNPTAETKINFWDLTDNNGNTFVNLLHIGYTG